MGADYKLVQYFVIGGMNGRAIPAASTRYMNPNGGHDDLAGAATVHFMAPFAMLLDHLYFSDQVAPGAGETMDCTLMVNAAPSILTCQIAGAGLLEASDLVNVVAVAQGDAISIQLISSLNAVPGYLRWSMRCRRI